MNFPQYGVFFKFNEQAFEIFFTAADPPNMQTKRPDAGYCCGNHHLESIKVEKLSRIYGNMGLERRPVIFAAQFPDKFGSESEIGARRSQEYGISLHCSLLLRAFICSMHLRTGGASFIQHSYE